MTRPVLIAMNNPMSSDPRCALFPSPPGCAGHRLFRMLHDAALGREITPTSYLRLFDRRNLVAGKTWSQSEAVEGARSLAPELDGRPVVVLGASTMDACIRGWGLQNGRPDWFVWVKRERVSSFLFDGEESPEFWFCLMPHPSGHCRKYNDPTTRERAGVILLELYQDALSG